MESRSTTRFDISTWLAMGVTGRCPSTDVRSDWPERPSDRAPFARDTNGAGRDVPVLVEPIGNPCDRYVVGRFAISFVSHSLHFYFCFIETTDATLTARLVINFQLSGLVLVETPIAGMYSVVGYIVVAIFIKRYTRYYLFPLW